MFEPSRAYPLVLLSLILLLISGAKEFLFLSLLFVVLLIALPSALAIPTKVAEAVIKGIGTAVSNIGLTLIFVTLITPYGFLYRLFQRTLTRKFFNLSGAKSYYTVEATIYGPHHFENPW